MGVDDAIGDWGSDQRVYVIAEAGASPGPRLVKIGVSVDPEARLRGLQTGSSRELELLATGPGGMVLEQRLHRVFAIKRTRGEWFLLDESEVATLRTFLADPAQHLGLSAPRSAPTARPGVPPARTFRLPPVGQLGWKGVVIALVVLGVMVQYALALIGVVLVWVGASAKPRSWMGSRPGPVRLGMLAAGLALFYAQAATGALIDNDEPSPASADEREEPDRRRSTGTTWRASGSGDCPGVDGDGWSANC